MKKLLIILLIVVPVIAIFKCNKPTSPVFSNELLGTRTLESVIENIWPGVMDRLAWNLSLAGYQTEFPQEIIIAIFKEERKLQVYAKDGLAIKLIKAYPFTAYSGRLGPKLKEGDKQIPEGLYKIEYLNPNSSYYLSMKVDYPNQFDKSKSILSNEDAMGGDIFIHGKAATIGCVPIGDKAIEELFFLTQMAMNNEVKVIISPRDFRLNSDYPNIESITWEDELYDKIQRALQRLPLA